MHIRAYNGKLRPSTKSLNISNNNYDIAVLVSIVLTVVNHPNPITKSSHGRIVNTAKPNPSCKESGQIDIVYNSLCKTDTKAVYSSNIECNNTPFLPVLPTFYYRAQ